MKLLARLLSFSLVVVCLSLGACSTFKSNNSTLPQASAKELFIEAEQALADADYQKAIHAYEALDSQYPFGEFSEQAKLDAIYAYYASDDMPEAAVAAERFIHLYPRARHVDYAYYMKGISNFQQNHGFLHKYFPYDESMRDIKNSRQAYDDFRDFIRLFPDSFYVSDAKQRMIYLRNLLAQKELHASEYYFQRRAYVAAANRASYLIQHYRQAPQTASALVLMIKSNRAIGLLKVANDALHVLEANYPERVREVS